MNDLKVGDRIYCNSWNDLKKYAWHLSAEGYGVAVIGFGDMSDNVLTITALPVEGFKEVANDERRD